jgi:hypothetical protein
MHRLALIAFVLATAACADTAQTETNEPDEVTSEGPQPFDHPTPPAPEDALQFSVGIFFPSCDTAALEYEVFDVRHADGTPVTGGYTCEAEFDDGGTQTGCVATYAFAEGGQHGYLVRVRETGTDRSGEVVGQRFVPLPLEVSLNVAAHKCALAFDVTTGVNQGAFTITEVRPADQVVGDPFFHGQTSHTFEVTQPGSYEVIAFAEDERSSGPICTQTVRATVEVDDCVEPPPCEVTAMATAAAQ